MVDGIQFHHTLNLQKTKIRTKHLRLYTKYAKMKDDFDGIEGVLFKNGKMAKREKIKIKIKSVKEKACHML